MLGFLLIGTPPLQPLTLEVTHLPCVSFYHYPSSSSSMETRLTSSRQSLLLSAIIVQLYSFTSPSSFDTQGLLSSTDLVALAISSLKYSASSIPSSSTSYFLSLSGQLQCPRGYVKFYSLRVSLLSTNSLQPLSMETSGSHFHQGLFGFYLSHKPHY